jgi:hypothetical protein
MNGTEIFPPIETPAPLTLIKNGIAHNGKYVINANDGTTVSTNIYIFVC